MLFQLFQLYKKKLSGFRITSLFSNGEVGGVYDPSDISTMQSSLGRSPLTGVEQYVSQLWDKSKNLTKSNTNLITNGALDTDLTGWTTEGAPTILEIVDGACHIAGGHNTGIRQYGISWNKSNTRNLIYTRMWIKVVSGSVKVEYAYSAGAIGPSPSGDWTLYEGYSMPSFSQDNLVIVCSGTSEFYVRGVEAYEVAGNHLFQNTTSYRPILRARYNLLEYSEVFTNVYWTNASSLFTITANTATAPDGNNTATTVVCGTSSTSAFLNSASITHVAGSTITISGYFKYVSGTGWIAFIIRNVSSSQQVIKYVDIQNGVLGNGVQSGSNVVEQDATIESVGDGWYRVTLVCTNAGTSAMWAYFPAAGNSNNSRDSTSNAYIWGAQFELSSYAGPYQRINAATDYVEKSTMGGNTFPRYLEFDGVDDYLMSSKIDFSDTDELTVVAAFNKDSDSANAVLVELSANSAANANTFALWSTYNNNYFMTESGGSSESIYNPATARTINSPFVVTMLSDISSDINTMRVNGVKVGTDVTDQGTGNYGNNYPIYVGSRGGVSDRFDGKLHQLIIRNRRTFEPELSNVEGYVANTVVATLETPFTPLSLYANNEAGVWYDISDISTMYSDYGTTTTKLTPVTDVEQSVAVVLDKSRGLVEGADVLNGGFDSDTVWTHNVNDIIADGVYTQVTSSSSVYQESPELLAVGDWLLYSFDMVARPVQGYVYPYVCGAVNTAYRTLQTGHYDWLIQIQSVTDQNIGLTFGNTPAGIAVDNLSIKKIFGSHTWQPTASARPVLRARYNRITYSEQLNNAAWGAGNITVTANAAIAPDGTMTATKMVNNTGTIGSFTYSNAIPASRTCTVSAYVKAGEHSSVDIGSLAWNTFGSATFNLSTLSWSGAGLGYLVSYGYEKLPNGWFRVWVVGIAPSITSLYVRPSTTGDGSSGIYVWGVQLDYCSSPNAYQKIAAATDYVTISTMGGFEFAKYLDFDAVDDWLPLPNRDSGVQLSYTVGYFPSLSAGCLFYHKGSSSNWMYAGAVNDTSTSLFNGATANAGYFGNVLFDGTNRGHVFASVSSNNVAHIEFTPTAGWTGCRIGKYTSYENPRWVHEIVIRDGEMAEVDRTALANYISDKVGVRV